MEILNVRKLAIGYLVNGYITVLPTDADYPLLEQWVADEKEVMPQYTQTNLDEQSTATKWGLVDTYMASLEVTSDISVGGKKFNASPQGIINIQNGMRGMNADSIKQWVESWASFETDLVEMEWILIEVERLRDLKIVEVGLV